MPPKLSAGLLLYRYRDPRQQLQLLVGHMGGPFFARKDEGGWSIPKGEHGADEDAFSAAQREFEEELGSPAPDVEYLELGAIRQSGGKIVTVWAAEADFDADAMVSNTFEIEWPPRSGRRQEFPELDRAAWFPADVARAKLVKGQQPFVDRLRERLGDVG